MIISNLNVSDGQVIEFAIQSGVVTVILKNWQDKIYTLVFKDVVGVESHSPEGVDLCHIKVLTESENVRKIRSIVEAEEDEITEYSFISTWNDFPILRIYGSELKID